MVLYAPGFVPVVDGEVLLQLLSTVVVVVVGGVGGVVVIVGIIGVVVAGQTPQLRH